MPKAHWVWQREKRCRFTTVQTSYRGGRKRAGLTGFLSVLDAERELYANEDLLAQSRKL